MNNSDKPTKGQQSGTAKQSSTTTPRTTNNNNSASNGSRVTQNQQVSGSSSQGAAQTQQDTSVARSGSKIQKVNVQQQHQPRPSTSNTAAARPEVTYIDLDEEEKDPFPPQPMKVEDEGLEQAYQQLSAAIDLQKSSRLANNKPSANKKVGRKYSNESLSSISCVDTIVIQENERLDRERKEQKSLFAALALQRKEEKRALIEEEEQARLRSLMPVAPTEMIKPQQVAQQPSAAALMPPPPPVVQEQQSSSESSEDLTLSQNKKEKKRDRKSLFKLREFSLRASSGRTQLDESDSKAVSKYIAAIATTYAAQGKTWAEVKKEVVPTMPGFMVVPSTGELSLMYSQRIRSQFSRANLGKNKVGSGAGGQGWSKSRDQTAMKQRNDRLDLEEELLQEDIIQWNDSAPAQVQVSYQPGNINVKVDTSHMFQVPHPKRQPEEAAVFLENNRAVWQAPNWGIVEYAQTLRKTAENQRMKAATLQKIANKCSLEAVQFSAENDVLKERLAQETKLLRDHEASLKQKIVSLMTEKLELVQDALAKGGNIDELMRQSYNTYKSAFIINSGDAQIIPPPWLPFVNEMLNETNAAHQRAFGRDPEDIANHIFGFINAAAEAQARDPNLLISTEMRVIIAFDLKIVLSLLYSKKVTSRGVTAHPLITQPLSPEALLWLGREKIWFTANLVNYGCDQIQKLGMQHVADIYSVVAHLNNLNAGPFPNWHASYIAQYFATPMLPNMSGYVFVRARTILHGKPIKVMELLKFGAYVAVGATPWQLDVASEFLKSGDWAQAMRDYKPEERIVLSQSEEEYKKLPPHKNKVLLKKQQDERIARQAIERGVRYQRLENNNTFRASTALVASREMLDLNEALDQIKKSQRLFSPSRHGGEKCPICWEFFVPAYTGYIASGPCGHPYHRNCFFGMATDSSAYCATCMRDLVTGENKFIPKKKEEEEEQ